jgi:hypothetical protein
LTGLGIRIGQPGSQDGNPNEVGLGRRIHGITPVTHFPAVSRWVGYAGTRGFAILGLSSSPASNPQGAPADPLGRDNPHGCILGFIKAAQEDNYSLAIQYFEPFKTKRRPSHLTKRNRQSSYLPFSTKNYQLSEFCEPGSAGAFGRWPAAGTGEGE